MLDVVMKCNETNAMLEQVRSQHIIEPPWGTAVVDVLRKNESKLWSRRGAVRTMRHILHARYRRHSLLQLRGDVV